MLITVKYITNGIAVLIKVKEKRTEERAVPVVLLREMFRPIASNTPGGRKKSENRKRRKSKNDEQGFIEKRRQKT